MVFPTITGTLKKKNSKGGWKERKCVLTDDVFSAYQVGKNEAKEKIDLISIDSVTIETSDILQIKEINGDIYLFKGSSTRGLDNVHMWSEELNERLRHVLSSALSAPALLASKTHIQGWLMKQSGDKNLGLQRRFVKIQGYSLCYYRSDASEEKSGEISLMPPTIIRTYDRSSDCRIFEILEGKRLYSFQAESYVEMKRWFDVATGVAAGSRELAEAAQRAKELAETPTRIRLFDDEGKEAFLTFLSTDLSCLYPVPDDSLDLADHLKFAKSVHSYLEEFYAEVRKYSASRGSRYEVLEAGMIRVNQFLAGRLLVAFDPSCPAIASAKLFHLHAIIDWISKYQLSLQHMFCPVTDAAMSPRFNEIFSLLPELCHRYVHGGGPGSGQDGAASHLIDHCLKVWEKLVNKPSEMVEQHIDGSFYTHAPTVMWEALNQHLSLATSTSSAILHVMIADKIVAALKTVLSIMMDYLESLDLKNPTDKELEGMEIEFLCALANDNAQHIEQVIALVENFEIDEIRVKIDDLFDPVTIMIVDCGRACLRRLAAFVGEDVEPQLAQVFTTPWVEGSQMHVTTATLADYMSDLDRFLMPFWTEKFNYILLEQVILRYCRAVLTAGSKSLARRAAVASVPVKLAKQSSVAVTSFMNFASRVFSGDEPSTGSSSRGQSPLDEFCEAQEDVLGRLAQDVNILNAFFRKHAGEETAAEFLGIINEVSTMLFMSIEEFEIHVMRQFAIYPSSAQAVHDILFLCLPLREDVGDEDITALRRTLQGALAIAAAQAQENLRLGVVEGRLGLLYADLMAQFEATVGRVDGSGAVTSATAGSLAQKMKDMANIPLAALKRGIELLNEDDDESSPLADPALEPEAIVDPEKAKLLLQRRNSALIKSTAGLVDEVLNVMTEQDESRTQQIMMMTEQERVQAELDQVRGPGVLVCEGFLEKKSPALHTLWQKRWFKILTRDNPSYDPSSPGPEASPRHIYQLLTYKTKGGTVNKALDCEQIRGLAVLLCHRELAYNPVQNRLLLRSEVSPADEVQVLPLPLFLGPGSGSGPSSGGSSSSSSAGVFLFSFSTKDGKEYELRAGKVDKMIAWVNVLAAACSLFFDSSSGVWTRGSPPLIVPVPLSLPDPVPSVPVIEMEEPPSPSKPPTAQLQARYSLTETAPTVPRVEMEAEAGALEAASLDEEKEKPKRPSVVLGQKEKQRREELLQEQERLRAQEAAIRLQRVAAKKAALDKVAAEEEAASRAAAEERRRAEAMLKAKVRQSGPEQVTVKNPFFAGEEVKNPLVEEIKDEYDSAPSSVSVSTSSTSSRSVFKNKKRVVKPAEPAPVAVSDPGPGPSSGPSGLSLMNPREMERIRKPSEPEESASLTEPVPLPTVSAASSPTGSGSIRAPRKVSFADEKENKVVVFDTQSPPDKYKSYADHEMDKNRNGKEMERFEVGQDEGEELQSLRRRRIAEASSSSCCCISS